MQYEPAKIEKKWRDYWEQKGLHHAPNNSSRPKYYCLDMFPYPSGEGLHVGHWRGYVLSDVWSRYMTLQGYQVLHPMGWDAFGLPAENAAIKRKIHPETHTKAAIANMKRQLIDMGSMYDWEREVNSSSPEYYKWTQWTFLQAYKLGLAYKKGAPINWCPSCRTGLADEEVKEGLCERCGAEVTKKDLPQWFFAITKYAQRLIDDLDQLDWPEKVKKMQADWIGRSEGAEVCFQVENREDKLWVFTTRPDTLFGATFMVISPEHPIVEKHKAQLRNYAEVAAYRDMSARKSDFERTELSKEKTGVRHDGLNAVNPVNGREIPIWISDYVLMSYGTGAIMAVPAHDERDYESAKVFGMPIVEVIAGGDIEKEAYTDVEDGTLVNSGFLNGLSVAEAKQRIIAWLEEKGLGERKINYKLRDWVFSRQRYWGEPIPVVYCEHCGIVPLPEEQLPLLLPDVENYEPTDSGESPLAAMTDWVNTVCPRCGAPARRETDTMPQWAGSSWYFLRYCDPHNDHAFADKKALDYWMNVDWYNGGMEHTTLHLLYSRFWHQFLHDLGLVSQPEPYQKRTSHGMILGENGEKMSKSRGNVINPDDIVDELGADAFRLYEMFMGAFDQAIPWSTNGARGCRRFLDRVWRLMDMRKDGDGYQKALTPLVHETIKKVGEDYEAMKFNTAIAAMMTLVNAFYDAGGCTRDELRTLVLLLSPVAPHICEEIWELMGFGGALSTVAWPKYDEIAMKRDTVEIAVQLNGKVRGHAVVPTDMTREQAEQELPGYPEVQAILDGKTPVKLIFVPGRLCNLIVK